MEVFDDFLACSGRAGGFTKIWTVPLAPDGSVAADAQELRFAQQVVNYIIIDKFYLVDIKFYSI